MFYKLLIFVILSALLMVSHSYAGDILLDQITGLSGDTAIIAGETVRFTFRAMNYDPWNIAGFTNGFRVYSPDGATWQPLAADTLPLNWSTMFEEAFLISFSSITGSGADTVGFGGLAFINPGFEPGFDENVWWIETMAFPEDTGKHICIDSSYFYPAGTWTWVDDEGTTVYPSWSGLRCLKIISGQTSLPAVDSFTFGQLNWYQDSVTIKFENSSWGYIEFNYIPDSLDIHYLNISADAGNGYAWIVQNHPLFPLAMNEEEGRLGLDFDITDLGIPDGSNLASLEFYYTIDDTLRISPPRGRGTPAEVEDIDRKARDGKTTDDPLPDTLGTPAGAKNTDEPTEVIIHNGVQGVQEGHCRCLAGAFARSIHWLNKENKLGSNKTAQQIYDDLAALKIGSTGPGATTYEQDVEAKQKYLKKLAKPKVAKTKILDLSNAIGKVKGVAEETGKDLWTWLHAEMPTEDVELHYDTHIITITGKFKAGTKCKVKYRDDETQGPGANQNKGDKAVKTGELIKEGGSYYFRESDKHPKFKVKVAISESIYEEPAKNAHNTDGYVPTHGNPTGTFWKVLRELFGRTLILAEWIDDGDGIFGEYDTVVFVDSITGIPSTEQIEFIGPTITVQNIYEPEISRYLDLLDDNQLVEPITDPVGTQWYEIYPDFLHKYEIEYWEDNGNGYLDSCDYIGLHALNGPDSCTTDLYHVEEIATDISTNPVAECTGMCGDANNDGNVNVSDAVSVINYVFVGGIEPQPVLACGDANNDGVVNVSDAVSIINYVFVGGDPPGDCAPGSANWHNGDCCPFE